MRIAAIAGPNGREEIPPGTDDHHQWIWVDHVSDLQLYRDADLFIDLDFSMDAARIGTLSRLLPAPVLINSVKDTLDEIGQPFIRINAWPGFLKRGVHELAIADAGMESVVAAIYDRLGWQYRIVPDIPGMISARVLATIINEAWYTLQDEVSTRQEIDTAMKLGTNYPYGPFEWSERIGPGRIYELLVAMSRTDDRYLPAAALTKEIAAKGS